MKQESLTKFEEETKTSQGKESALPDNDCLTAEFNHEAAYQVYNTSKLIRRLLLDMKPVIACPPSLDDLDSCDKLIPDLLYNMIAWILTSDSRFSTDRVSMVSSKVHQQVLSVAQDLMHCASRGRIKTPKHVVLPHWECRINYNPE